MFLSKSFPKSLLKNLSPSQPYQISYPSYLELLNMLHRYFPSKHLPPSLEPSPSLPIYISLSVKAEINQRVQEIIYDLTKLLFTFRKKEDEIPLFVNDFSIPQLDTPIYEFLNKYLGNEREIVLKCALMDEENIYLAKDLIEGYYKSRNTLSLQRKFNKLEIVDHWNKVAFFKNFNYSNATKLFDRQELESVWKHIQNLKNKRMQNEEKIDNEDEAREMLYLVKIEILIDELLSESLRSKNFWDLLSGLVPEENLLQQIIIESESCSISRESRVLAYSNSEKFLNLFKTQYGKLNNREKLKLIAMLGNRNEALDLIFLNDFDSVIETADFREMCQLARLFPRDKSLIDFLISQDLSEENINDLVRYKSKLHYFV